MVEVKELKLLKMKLNLKKSFKTAKIEAQKYFANDEVYIEKFFQNPRHIEVQILSGKNRTAHLYEETAQFNEDIKN